APGGNWPDCVTMRIRELASSVNAMGRLRTADIVCLALGGPRHQINGPVIGVVMGHLDISPPHGYKDVRCSGGVSPGTQASPLPGREAGRHRWLSRTGC